MRRLIAALCIAMAGCTSIPERFSQDQAASPNCGYVVGAKTRDGFGLEIAYTAYRFFPSPDGPAQEARECFVATARTLAAKEGRKVAPMGAVDMPASPHRNAVDGRYLVYVTGVARFAD